MKETYDVEICTADVTVVRLIAGKVEPEEDRRGNLGSDQRSLEGGPRPADRYKWSDMGSPL